MKIAVHIQPAGSYLVIPKNPGCENDTLWERRPMLVIEANTDHPDIEQTILTLTKDWNQKGGLASVAVEILTRVFTEGVRYGMQKEENRKNDGGNS